MENTQRKYMIVVSEQNISLLAAICPMLEFVAVDGFQSDNHPEFVLLVNPKPQNTQTVPQLEQQDEKPQPTE